jgi:hypothetical protein
MRRLVRILAYAWAGPNTLVALVAGGITLLTGGRMQCVEGAIEFWGGFARWFLRHRMLARGAGAMALGHVIFGQTRNELETARAHEHVHIKQYERWGPLMAPAYLLCSLWLWTRGKSPYWDNPFEQDAYRRFP